MVAHHYEPERGPCLVSVGCFSEWDIKFADGTAMEVKLDFAAETTGNAAVEYWDKRRNKPTGILATEADLWLHCIPRGSLIQCYEIDVKKLQKLCIEEGERKRGGDGNSSLLKLIPVERLQRISNAEFDITCEPLHLVKNRNRPATMGRQNPQLLTRNFLTRRE